MKEVMPERQAPQAVAELQKLYNHYKKLPRGQKLTLKIVADQCGVKTLATISCWISEGNLHHDPQGASLTNLNEFLNKAKDKAWLERTIKKGGK